MAQPRWERQDARLVRQLGVYQRATERSWADTWRRLQAELRRELAALAEEGPTVSRAVRLRQIENAAAMVAQAVEEVAATTRTEASRHLAERVAQGARDSQELIQEQLPTSSPYAIQQANPQAMRAIVARSLEQITVLSWPLSREAHAAVATQLRQALALGWGPRKTAARMLEEAHGVFEGGRARALNIARTEQLDAYRAGAQQLQQANAELLEGWRWVTTLGSERTCMVCIAMHGTLHELEEPGPMGHPSCRCARQPIVKSWAELGIQARDTRPPLGPTGEEWLARQPLAQQRAILGPTRLALYQEGTPLSAMVQLRKNPGWRPSVQPVPLDRLG